MSIFLYNKVWVVIVISTACVVTSAAPKPTHKSRVVDRPLSGEQHFDGEEHNAEYDHDAFVGKEEAKSFDELTPEESQKRLGLLFVKIDKDGDNRVSPAELQSWMRHIQQQSLITERDKQWAELNPKDPQLLTWEEYVKHTYKDNIDDDDDDAEEDAKEKASDERRWKLADTNDDGMLDKEEFFNFVHPEEGEHMKESLIQETLDEVDTDHDGMISISEYLTDLANEDDDDEDDDENEQGWTPEDEQEFRKEMDKDGDGMLNRDEIYQWLVPDDYDHIVDESDHLFAEADDDKDGYLTGQEMIDKYDLFVGSQATDFGNVLRHQEL